MTTTNKSKNRKKFNAKPKKSNQYGNFEKMGFDWTLLKNIHYKGYKMLTPIQRKVIPLILKGKNVIATSRTGSGKTAAFLLPIIQKINDLKTINPCKSKVNMIGHTIKAIIISPTRELALQTFKFSKEFSKNLKVKCDLILGGDSLETQFALFHNKDPHEQPDILIATPGRLMHIFEEMNIGRLSNMKFLVLDEADRLLELGFAPQIGVLFQNHLPILNMNNSGLFSQPSNSHSMQILLFSATFSSQMAQTFTNSGCVNAADDQASSIFPDYDETNPSSFVFAKCDTDYKISPQLKMEFIACKGNNHFTLSTSASPDKLNCLFYLLNKHSNSSGNDSKKLRKSPRCSKVIGGNSERVEDSCGIMAFPDRSNESARAKTISTYAKLQDKNAQPCIITNTTQTKDVSTDTSSQSQITKTDVLKEEKATKKWKTLVFLPTKYHVDYIKELIQVQLGIDCAYVYSSLDPSARKLNLNNFREGLTEILLVTDIAARGLDIPLLDCVINFTFPSTPKLFLHRIGRVARAGNVGTAYSLVSHHEVPQVLDFLNYIGQDLVYLRAGIFPDTITQERLEEGISRPFHLFGNVPEDLAELSGINTTSTQSVFTSCTDKSLVSNVKLSDKEYDLNYLATVCDRAMGKFEKSQSKPSHGSIRKAKSEFIDFGGAGMLKPHALFEAEGGVCFNKNNNPSSSSSLLRKQHCLDDKLRFLERLKHFKTREISQQKVLHFPSNNKFIGKDFHTESSASVQSSAFFSSANPSSIDKVTTEADIASNSKLPLPRISRESNVMIPLSFNTLGGRGVAEQNRKNGFRMPKFADSRLFIPYVAPDNEGVSDVLLETPESMILDLKTDDSKQLKSTSFGSQPAHSNHNNNNQRNKLIWDQKRKRFVNMNDQINGTKKQRTIRNESGVRVKIQGNLGRGGSGGFGKGAANKHTELYQKWLEKTSGGQILPAVATSKLIHDSSSKQPRGAGNRIVTHENQDFDDNDNENNDEEKQLRNLENSKKDWRFKRNGPGSNNYTNTKGRASTRDQSVQNLKSQKRFPSNKPNSNPSKRRNLGLKHPEQAFKIRYAKEQKQAFQTYRRNLNATKRESKNKRKKNRR